MKKNLLASAIFFGATAGAFGQSSDPIDDILVCQQIADEAARLACFDAAAVRLTAERENGLVGIYREDIEAVERDAFGFDLPSMPTISLSMFRGNGGNSPDPLDPATTPERLASNDPAPAPAPVRQPAETTVATNTAEPARPQAAEEERRGLISRIPGLGGRRGSSEPEAPAAVASVSDAQPINGVQVVERNDDGGVERIVMDIERVREIAYGRYRFYMTNGQRWVMSGSERFNYDEDADNFAEIRRAAWGSYFMQINGQGRAIRVQRER